MLCAWHFVRSYPHNNQTSVAAHSLFRVPPFPPAAERDLLAVALGHRTIDASQGSAASGEFPVDISQVRASRSIKKMRTTTPRFCETVSAKRFIYSSRP